MRQVAPLDAAIIEAGNGSIEEWSIARLSDLACESARGEALCTLHAACTAHASMNEAASM